MTVVPTTLNRTCAFTGLKALGLAVLFCAAMQPAFAQSESSWSNQGLIYLLGPTLDGTSGIGPIDTSVDMSASDVFETLDGAFLGMYRGEGERWGVMIDVVYMDLKAEGAGDGGTCTICQLPIEGVVGALGCAGGATGCAGRFCASSLLALCLSIWSHA